MIFSATRRSLRTICWCFGFVVVLIGSFNAYAVKVTVDADGGAGYTGLDTVLSAIQNWLIDPDTVEFIGADQDTFTWKTDVNRDIWTIVFRSRTTNPANFAVINHSEVSKSFNLFNMDTTVFENLILSTTVGFNLGQSKKHTFNRCIIRKSSGTYAIHAEGTAANVTFTNCLFQGNTSTNVFDINFWGGTPSFVVTNCTFDNNTGVWDEDPVNYFSGISLTNCIFSNNTTTFRGDTLRKRTTYSVTSEAVAKYGTGCVSNIDPLYRVAAVASRVNPVDWRPTAASPARNRGTTANNTITVDISSAIRTQDSSGKRDAGCWDIFDTLASPVPRVLADTSVGVGKPLVVKMTATGTAPFTYSWRRVGATTPVSTSDSLKIAAVTLADDSARFFCVVTNARDSVVSNTFKLHVVALPVITNQPDTVSVYLGDTATFSIVATGENLTYAWKRGATAIVGATAASYKIGTVAADSGALFTCTVTSALSGSVVSKAALLRVLPLMPKITGRTADTTLKESQSVTLRVVAQGKPVLTYSWYKVGDTTKVSSTDSLPLRSMTPVDSIRYKCVVANGSGKDSVTIRLKVTPGTPPNITSQSLPSITSLVGEKVVLSVSASGTAPLKYTWYKGTTAAADSIATGDQYTIAAVAANDTGIYYCIVKNIFASDTTEAIVLSLRTIPQFNPLTIKATLVDPMRARVTLKNFLGLPFAAGASPYVDSVGIWYGTVTFPAGTLSPTDASLIRLPLSKMRAGGTDSYDTTLQFFAASPEKCGMLYMVVSPLWKNPDTVLSTVSSMQRASVTMCDTTPLANLLVLDVGYQRVSDSIVVSIGNLKSLNRDSLMYLTIECDIAGTTRLDTTDWIVSANLPAASENFLSRTYRNALFAGLEDSLTVRVSLRGVRGNVSAPVVKKLSIGRLRPLNNATIQIDLVEEKSINLHWSFPSTPDNDSVQIWWGKQQVPLAAVFDTAIFESRSFPGNASVFTITDLESGVLYSVGLQIFKDGAWSMVTALSRDTATTKVPFHTDIINTIVNVTAGFDSVRNVITLSWDLDTVGNGLLSSLEVGIVWSAGVPPVGTSVTVGAYGKMVTPLMVKGDATTIDLGGNLLFDTTYNIALLLRRKGNPNWASATAGSRAAVVIPLLKWQGVNYFSGADTLVTAFNKQVIIRKEKGTGTVSVSDTLRIFTPVSSMNGFVAVRRFGVDFVKDIKSDPILFGMKYDGALLGIRKASDIRMYQFNPDSGWRVIEDCILDTAQHMVTIVKNNNMSTDPFMLMIDTIAPVVTMLGDTSLAVEPNQPVVDSFTVTDNVANSSARLFYWRVTKPAADLPFARCSKDKNTLYLTVPADSISTVKGVRTLLVVSDGLSFDTVDVSRTVFRSTSDDVVLQEQVWTPVRTTTTLADSSVEAVLDELKVNGEWVYDSIQFRMFRWMGTPQQADVSGMAKKNNWVEYRTPDRELFNIVPGRVIWVKPQKLVAIGSLGAGTTVSLRSPCTIRLPAGDWTDIALPYNFDIRIGDILRATSTDPSITAGIRIYKWNFNQDSGYATASSKYNVDIPGSDSSSSILYSRSTTGEGMGTYTIYNNNVFDVNLVIPALPASYSDYTPLADGLSKRKTANDEWCVTVSGRSAGGAVAPVYCALRSGKGVRTTPLPPAFGKQRIEVIEPVRSAACGSVVYHEVPKGGCVFPLVFTNSENRPTTITCDISLFGKLPDTYHIGMYNPSQKSVAIAGAFDQPEISLAAQSTERRWLIVGDSSFIAAWSQHAAVELSLLRIFPNPCRGDIRLQFTLPFDDISQVRIALFNQLGQRVWNKNLQGRSLRNGTNTLMLQLSGKNALAAGTYLVRVATVNSKGAVTATRQQRLLYMP